MEWRMSCASAADTESRSTLMKTVATQASPAHATQVTIDAGAIEGTRSGDVLSFKGIPYTQPPIGNLRWRAPQPVTRWPGVRQTTEFGHDCMQAAFDDAIAPLATTPSEDCLVLNVWRPAVATPSRRLPVMVWLHGGSFVNGGSSSPVMDGGPLTRHGLVVVSLNYRLGRFGFFAHPALLAAQEGPVGNFGYMDQIAALKWVRSNIAVFGGNPECVTLVGESAGGASVLQLLTSRAASGLFHRVVVLSGGGRRALAARCMTGGTPEEPSADQSDAAFAASLGIEGSGPDALAKLRELPAEAIVGDLSPRQALGPIVLAGATSIPGTPMIDGTIVTGDPGDTLYRLRQPRMPLVIGTTALDAPLFFPPRTDPFTYFGPSAEKARAAYEAGEADTFRPIPDLPAGVEAPSAAAIALASDITMHEPARFAARCVTASGDSAWLYRFTYVAEAIPTRGAGAAHAHELPYLFDTVQALYGANVTDKDRETARAFSTYIANFVSGGDPNSRKLPKWPAFDVARYDVMNFTLDEGPVFSPDPRAAHIALVEKVADAQQR
jgi:para-nitrobenzyl esterase